MIDSIRADALADIDLLALCGNDEAMAVRVQRVVGLIDDLARKHAGNGLSVPLLAAHGCVGLVTASEAIEGSATDDCLAPLATGIESAMLDALRKARATKTEPAIPPEQPPQEIP